MLLPRDISPSTEEAQQRSILLFHFYHPPLPCTISFNPFSSLCFLLEITSHDSAVSIEGQGGRKSLSHIAKICLSERTSRIGGNIRRVRRLATGCGCGLLVCSQSVSLFRGSGCRLRASQVHWGYG